MKISFVTPTYNRADLLLETIESIFFSVRCSPNLSFEIVIVDDASKDNTKEKIYEFYSNSIKDNTIIYDRLPVNMGVTAAKNRGVEIASGDWIVFIDSDDLLIPSSFRDFLNVLKEKNDFSAVFFSCEDFNGMRIGAPFKSFSLRLDEYIKHGTYGEKLPVLKRDIARCYPYVNDLRGFESIAYYRILLSKNKIWVSELIVRKYRTNNDDRLSTSMGRFRRSALLAKGYKLLVNDFERSGTIVPFKFKIKRLVYGFFGVLIGCF